MSRAMKVCPTQGCITLIKSSEKLCPQCTALQRKKTDSNRPTSAMRGYDTQWRWIRAMQLRQNPFCVDCGNPATEVDHIIPLSQGGSNHRDNLQSRCKRCHSRKTAKFDGGFGNKRKNLVKGE